MLQLKVSYYSQFEKRLKLNWICENFVCIFTVYKKTHFKFQGQCAYSDEAQREGCESKDFFEFTCPNRPEMIGAHPRFPDPLGGMIQLILTAHA